MPPTEVRSNIGSEEEALEGWIPCRQIGGQMQLPRSSVFESAPAGVGTRSKGSGEGPMPGLVKELP